MMDYKFEKVFREVMDWLPDNYKIPDEFIDDLFQSMEALNTNKDNIESNPEYEKIVNLFIGEWALRSFGILSNSPSILQYIFRGFFVQISNTLSCILKLVKDGFDYQSINLVRNLIEISYTLLTLIIDEESRNKFLEAAKNGNEKTIWYKYFRFERMEKIIWKYISSIGNENEVTFLKNKGSEIYHWLSSFVHNDFINILFYSHSEPEYEDGEMAINLQGHYVTRVTKILEQVIEIMFLVDMLFVKILSDNQISISKNDLCTESEGQDYWNQAMAIYFITNKYFIELKGNESNGNNN